MNSLVASAGQGVCGADALRLSVGAACFPEDGTDAEELLAAADARMYHMKRRHHAERAAEQSLTQLARAVEAPAEIADPAESTS